MFSLAVEPVDKDVVKQGPRNVKTPMLTKNLVLNVLLSASIIIVGTLWVFKREVSFYLNLNITNGSSFTFQAFFFFFFAIIKSVHLSRSHTISFKFTYSQIF